MRPALFGAALLVALVAPATARAADVCKGVEVKEDKFGGGKSAIGMVQPLGMTRAIGIFLQAKTGEVSMTVTVKEAGALSGGVAVGSQVSFLFVDGQVLTLATATEAALQSYVSGDFILTNVPYTFVLTPEQTEMFASKVLSTVRVPVVSQGTTIDWESNAGVQKTLQSVAKCLQTL